MSLRRSHPLLVAASVFAFAAFPSTASSTPLIVEAVNEGTGIYGTHRWKNPEQTIIAGERVTFRNPYTGLPYHGLKFTGSAPSPCTGTIPAAEGGAPNWEGECTFSTPGTYAFICTVHPAEMKGVIIVPGTPKAKTNPASAGNQTEAMLNGSVEPEGNAVEYHFEYGTNSLSEHTTPSSTLGTTDFAPHSVSMPVSGLSPEKTYHFKLVATYGAGKTAVATAEQTFTTPGPTAPTVKLSAVTGLKEAEATLNGTVDPNGGEETKYFFEYGVAPTFEKTTIKTLPADNTSHSAAETLTKLTPATLYHFKLVAKNKAGENTVEGTFKTLSSAPTEPQPTPPHENPPLSPPPTVSSMPPSPEPLIPLAEPPPSLAGLSVHAAQHGPSVRGSLDVSPSEAGDRLEVALFAARASLAAVHHPGGVRVGRLVRAAVHAGVVSFTAPLTARARVALRRHHRLALSVQIVLMPLGGSPASVTRSVVLHG